MWWIFQYRAGKSTCIESGGKKEVFGVLLYADKHQKEEGGSPTEEKANEILGEINRRGKAAPFQVLIEVHSGS